ncbi:MAG: NADH-quinone oxidoreductase subunit L [Actinomycetota bacterium]
MVIAHQSTPAIIENAWIVVAFPLLGAALLFAFGRRIGRGSGPIATIMMIGSAVGSLMIFGELLKRPSEQRSFVEPLWQWFSAGDASVSISTRIDPLTVMMLLVVTCVGALIHLYSVGYMRGDAREPRFFAYLNLFAASMLVLVLADNFLVLFLGWELVGMCSYLLIGFWFEDRGNAAAAKKAFITNRVGDAAFLIALFLMLSTFGSFSFEVIGQASGAVLSAGTALAIALLLFVGAAAKSAQIPLYVWLPDAMAGPTPVSALIHAATMVTAGIYLVVRAAPIFEVSPLASDVVAWVGVATMLLAGLMAIVQDDIKKILAYSTVSQLGYMFIGVGVGASAAGLFHLVTHAFFKALLFLGAGSVMHALSGRTDITTMGGLFRKIPWTSVTFIAGWLAIIGFPLTAGFFSKDQILEGAYVADQQAIWILGLVGAVITGFYMTRLVVLTFFGKPRDPDLHPHESPPSMVFPLVLLAVASLVGGWLINAHPEDGRLVGWLAPVLGQHEAAHGALSATTLSIIASGAGLIGALVAIVAYGFRRFDWQARRERPGILWRVARDRFYVDHAYEFIFTGLGKVGATALAYVVDARWIDGAVGSVGAVSTRVAQLARRLQNGLVRTYALGILAGTVLMLAYMVGRNW